MVVPPRVVRGVVGRIEWGYFVAAAINNYTLFPRSDGTWRIAATVVRFDAFKLRQRPLIFVAPHKDGEWRWPMRELELGPGHGPRELRATLGQQCPEMLTAR